MTLHISTPCTEVDRPSLFGPIATRRPGVALYRNGCKRVLDIALVTVAAVPALTILVPLCLLLAAQGGSPFYSQRRVGLNGRIFRMWKMRSMVPNADALLAAYLEATPAAAEEWARSQKLRNDPRITPLGRIIRKTSLDELPQLWNVFRGDMSIVGPRPMMIDQMDLYPGTAYYTLRPGITGFWQTSVRNESSFADRAEYDTAYAKALSLGTDIAVMFRTVAVVIRGTGC